MYLKFLLMVFEASVVVLGFLVVKKLCLIKSLHLKLVFLSAWCSFVLWP